MVPSVTAVCVVHALLPEPSTPTGLTSIDKRPVPGPVQVGPLGLAGDSQQDTPHHGGAEFAVYLYAEEDAAAWAAELGREVPPGLFGENLRTAGLDVSGLVVGSRLAVGDAVVLEVTAPRNPCATFARRMGEPHWVRRFADRRAPGAYARVEASGAVRAGDALTLLSVPAHGVTVADLMAPALPGAAAALLAAEEASEVVLGERMRRGARQELARG
ncbi:MAG: MOSC domain-containing protein [Candidatus Nanopelagicales bacterium]|jgi:MOSC domain-containing protein YiiM|nr:MOSC domain-containing protein [Candidatus Nanopelagicales bacterium]